MLLGVAGRRPKYWWDLGQSIDSDLGGLLGTHVRNSNGLYTNPTTGLITTVGNNIPRFERQDGLLALLDEPEGTNLIHFSHELGNAASGGWWTNINLTNVTANGMLAPDGNVVADGLIANANDVTHGIYETSIPGIGQNDKVAFTCFGKIGNKNWVQLELQFRNAAGGGLGDTCSYYFNINSGSIGTPSAVGFTTIHDYIIEEAANGFYRIGLIASSSEALADRLYIIMRSAHADTDNDFSGDGSVNTWFWEANLMKQDFFSSPVPTSGGTVTRATESGYPLWDLPLGLFNAEGLCSVWVRFGYAYDAPPIGTFSGIASCRDSLVSFVYNKVDAGPAGNIYNHDGANVANVLLNWSANTWYKFVAKWSSTTSKMRVGYDSGAGIVWSVERAFDGSYNLGTSLRLAFDLYGPMWLRDLRLYDRIPSDSEINSMGSP